MSTSTDHREVPHFGRWMDPSSKMVSWVMTHGACGDEMQPDGGEYRHMEQDGRTHTHMCIVRALVMCHCVCRVPHYCNNPEIP